MAVDNKFFHSTEGIFAQFTKLYPLLFQYPWGKPPGTPDGFAS